MTCIVGVVDDDKVIMGGDSAGVAGLHVVTRTDPKVFKNKEYLIGFTSSFRMGQILMFADLPKCEVKKPDAVYKFMVTKFVPAIRKIFKKEGYLKKTNEVESGGTFLVAVKGQLFSICGDFQVGAERYSYAAVGCGDEIAYGSLHGTAAADHENDLKDECPLLGGRHRVTLALEAASQFSGGVCPPFTILEMNK